MAVSQPALGTVDSLADDITARLADLDIEAMRRYLEANDRRQTAPTSAAREHSAAEALAAARWLWLLPTLTCRQGVTKRAEGGPRDEDEGSACQTRNSISVQAKIRKRIQQAEIGNRLG